MVNLGQTGERRQNLSHYDILINKFSSSHTITCLPIFNVFSRLHHSNYLHYFRPTSSFFRQFKIIALFHICIWELCSLLYPLLTVCLMFTIMPLFDPFIPILSYCPNFTIFQILEIYTYNRKLLSKTK